MATAEQVIAQIQTYIATLTGIRYAPEDPSEKLDTELSSICYVMAGTNVIGPPELRTSLETYVVEILTPRKDLPRDHQRIIPFVDSVPNKLFLELKRDYWGGMISTHGNIEVALIVVVYAGVEYLGYRFSVLNVKRQTTIA